MIKFGEEDPPLPEMDRQVAVSAKVAVYGSTAVREIYEEWFVRVKKLLDNYTLTKAEPRGIPSDC